MLLAPGDGEGDDADAEFIGDLFEAGGGFEGAFVDEALGHAVLACAAVDEVIGEAGSGGMAVAGVVFAGEDATAEGGVGEEADVFLAADLGELAFAASVDEGEVVLDGVVSGESVGFGLPEAFHDAPGGFVAAADDADFAGGDEFGEGAEGFFVAHAVIGPVGLVEIDVIGFAAA